MIELFNVRPGEIFDHALISINGRSANHEQLKVEVVDNSGRSMCWSIKNEHFKVRFVNLELKIDKEIKLKT
jgi:hypothetical protein